MPRATPEISVPCSALKVSATPRLIVLLRAIAGLGAFPALAGMIAAMASASFVALLWALPLVAAVAGLVGVARRAPIGAGKVRIAGGRAYLEGAKRTSSFALNDVAWGARARRPGAVDLELKDGRRIELQTERPEDVEALLVATGTTVDRRAITVPLRRVIGPFVSGVLWFFLFMFAISATLGVVGKNLDDAFLVSLGSTLLAPVLSVLGAFVMVRLRKPRLTVGIDGLRIKMGFKERFIPHRAITSVEMVPSAQGDLSGMVAGVLRVNTTTHGVLDLPIVGWSNEDVDRVVVRMREAMAAQQASGTDPAAEAFARGGKDVPTWRAEVLRAVSADGGFRTRRVSLQDAESVLSNVAAPLDQRIGAALALRASGTEGYAERIRIAADATADPHAARALALAAAEEEEAALGELLASTARTEARRT